MNIHISLQHPIPVSDLESIASMLRNRKVLCGVRNPSADWYAPRWYAHEEARDQRTFWLLLDRNVYSLITQLADGDACASTDDHRLAAAVLCLARCSNLKTDSRIAVLEHELDSGCPRLASEHPKFLRVFEADPRCLADFALGRCATMTVSTDSTRSHAELPVISEADRPIAWRFNYGRALKLASLMLDDGFTNDADRMLAYLHWCRDEFLFSAGATVYGFLALSPRRKGGMFKRLRGNDVEKAMRGVRNAAWDITLINEWEDKHRAFSKTKNYYLICSFDRAIIDVVQGMLTHEQEAGLRRERLRDSILTNWGAQGDTLFGEYETMCRTAHDDVKRPAKQDLPRSHWEAKIDELETRVKNAIADRRDS